MIKGIGLGKGAVAKPAKVSAGSAKKSDKAAAGQNKAGRPDSPKATASASGPSTAGPSPAADPRRMFRPPVRSGRPQAAQAQPSEIKDAGKVQGAGKPNKKGGPRGPVLFELPPPPRKGKATAPVPKAIESNPEYQSAMAQLQENGILGKKLRKQLNRLLSAAEPATTTAVPAAFAAEGTTPADAPGKDKAGKLLLNLVKHLANPESILQGEGTWSCTVASLQATVAQLSPPRYARMVIDLATQGETKTPGKARILADHRGLEREADGRDMIEDLFQESMLTAAQRWEESVPASRSGPLAQGQTDQDYGRGAYGGTKRYGNGTYRASRRYAGDEQETVGRGLTARSYTRLITEVFGKRHDILKATPEKPLDPQETTHMLQQALRRGPVPAGVSIPSDDRKGRMHHAIRVVGLEDESGRSTLHPDKKIDGQKPGKPSVVIVADPQTGERTTVPIGKFLKDVDFLTLPDEIVNPPLANMRFASQSVYSNNLVGTGRVATKNAVPPTWINRGLQS